jgi:hypothetical protein
VAGQAREIARAGTQQVREMGQSARERTLHELNQRRQSFAGEVEKLADTLEQQRGQSQGAGPVLDFAASAARRFSTALRDRSAEELFDGVRRNPMAVLAGTFALGFFATRLFRS